MKKRILPLLMFIISFIICSNIVEAASKGCYFCEASGTASWVSEPSGYCQSGWVYKEDIKKGKCKFDCTSKEDCSKVNWLATCEYVQLNAPDTQKRENVTIYFNKNFMKLYVNGESTDVTIPKSMLKGLLDNYNNRKKGSNGCPNYVYYIFHNYQDNMTAPLITEEFTLDSKNFELEKNCSTNQYCNDKIYKLQVENPINEDFKEDTYDSCDKLIGPTAKNLINEIMKWVRIAVPLLLTGLGVFDFVQATFSSKEENMKKSREKFIKRIIAAILVFFAPILINLILDLANNAWNWINPETCIK